MAANARPMVRGRASRGRGSNTIVAWRLVVRALRSVIHPHLHRLSTGELLEQRQVVVIERFDEHRVGATRYGPVGPLATAIGEPHLAAYGSRCLGSRCDR